MDNFITAASPQGNKKKKSKKIILYLFGLAAAAIATVGIYGVFAYKVLNLPRDMGDDIVARVKKDKGEDKKPYNRKSPLSGKENFEDLKVGAKSLMANPETKQIDAAVALDQYLKDIATHPIQVRRADGSGASDAIVYDPLLSTAPPFQEVKGSNGRIYKMDYEDNSALQERYIKVRTLERAIANEMGGTSFLVRPPGRIANRPADGTQNG